MQSLSKHGRFAYLENLGSSGAHVAARIDADWQISPPPTGTASPRWSCFAQRRWILAQPRQWRPAS